MASDTEQQHTLDREDLGLFRWRQDCFLDAGFTPRQALRLAEMGADHHQAEHLLRQGCPAGLVVKLLRPLDYY